MGRCYWLVHGKGQPRADLESWRAFVCEDALTCTLQRDGRWRKMLEILTGEPVVGRRQAPDCCTARPTELQRRRHRRLEHSHFPSRGRQGNIATASHRSCLVSKRKIGPLTCAASFRSLDPPAELSRNQVSTAFMSRKQALSSSFYSTLDVS